MPVISNVKAQVNKLYSNVMKTPMAKGIGSTLKDEGLIARSQSQILNNISSKNAEQALAKLKPIGDIMGADAKKISEGNMELISKVGLGGVSDKKTLGYMNKRSSLSDEIKTAQEKAIINSAKNKGLEHLSPIDEAKASSLINSSARSVDGQLAFMTPVMAAKEYYGNPLLGAIEGMKSGDRQAITNNLTTLGVRGTATAGIVGASSLAVNSTVKLTGNTIDRMRGNTDERQ